MNIKILCSLTVLAAILPSFGQPTITTLKLMGQPQAPGDQLPFGLHPYRTFAVNPGTNVYSVSPGANVYLTVTASSLETPTYQWCLDQSNLPGQTATNLNLSSLQLSNAGDYNVVVSDSSGSVTSLVARLTLDATFTKITNDPIVTNAIPGQKGSIGGTWGDYNNDGLPDLLVFNGLDGFTSVPFLYSNKADGTFANINLGAPVAIKAQTFSACWGDYDNDSNLDLYLANTIGTTAGAPNLLYHNDGNGVFHQITTGSIVTDSALTLGAAWADYDQDGFLDLFVTTYDTSANSHCFLYHNNHDSTFTSITSSVLVTDLGSATGCAWGDYDNDGKIDLFVCGGRGSVLAMNRLYHNNGDGTFTRVTTAGGIVTDQGICKTCAWGDYDNDGFLDLFVSNAASGAGNFLYHNNGDGTFTRVTADVVANDPGNNIVCGAWGDYDNDGFLDLFVTDEGISTITPTVVNRLYHNNGNGTFTKVTTGSPVNEYSDCFGCCFVDYDNDGFLDLFAARGDNRGSFLYHNNLPATGNSNAWLTVKLVGTVSNRSAIGAKVRAKARIGGNTTWQLRQITGGGGTDGHNELWANFGLGNITNVDTVRIEWPSGTVQEFQNVAPNQILTITEPPRLLASTTNGVPQFSIKGGRFMQYDILASPDLAVWSPIGALTITNLNGTALIVDTNPPALDQRFYRAVSW